MATVKSLARPGEVVQLCVDNSVAFSYLRKGGGPLDSLNSMMSELWLWCMARHIEVQPSLVKSADKLADDLSRTPVDHGDYTLSWPVLSLLLRQFRPLVVPRIDMFASPGNSRFPRFVCRYPHWQAELVDALSCSLGQVTTCYANPP